MTEIRKPGRPRKEVVDIAENLNIHVSEHESEDSVLYKINQQPKALVDNAMKHVAELPAQAPRHDNTKEDVLKAVEKFTAIEGFQAIFNEEDNTVHFKCKGAEECVNLSIPLRIIKMKAETVSRGRRGLRAIRDNTYTGYADSIIMA